MAEDLVLHDSPVAKFLSQVDVTRKSTQNRPRSSLMDEISEPAASPSEQKPITSAETSDNKISTSLQKEKIPIVKVDDDIIRRHASTRLDTAGSARPSDKPGQLRQRVVFSNGTLYEMLMERLAGTEIAAEYRNLKNQIEACRSLYIQNALKSSVAASNIDSHMLHILYYESTLHNRTGASTLRKQLDFTTLWQSIGALLVFLFALLIQLALFQIFAPLTAAAAVAVLLVIVIRILALNAIARFGRQHERNLENLDELLKNSSSITQSVKRGLQYIQEVELVSLGFKLSSPLSPIARLERLSKARKSNLLRHSIQESLDGILATLNAENDEFPTETADPLALASLKTSFVDFQQSNFAFLRKMLDSLKSEKEEQLDNFSRFSRLLEQLSKQLEHGSKRVQYAYNCEEWLIDETKSDGGRKKVHLIGAPAEQLMDYLSAFQNQLTTMGARVSLIKQTFGSIASDGEGNADTSQAPSMNEVFEMFSKLKEEMDELSLLHQNCDRALSRVLTEKRIPVDQASIDSNRITPSRDKSNDSIDLAEEESATSALDVEKLEKLIAEAVESVYEAETAAQDSESSSRARPKLTREQRIAEQKKKRQEVASSTDSVFERLAMVRELQNVLGSRKKFKPAPAPEDLEIPRSNPNI